MEDKFSSWFDSVFARHCPNCHSPCCSGTRHIITLTSDDDMGLFLESGLSFYTWEKLNKETVLNWYNKLPALSAKRTILNKDGGLIEQPSLIQIPENIATLAGSENARKVSPDFTIALYVHRNCPFFDNSTRLCKVHKDSRRPACCKSHPLVFFEENSRKIIGIQKGCHLNSVFDEMEKDFNLEFSGTEYSLRKGVEGARGFR